MGKSLGPYRRYNAPIGVERGDLGNIPGCSENSCGALSAVLRLEPGETRSLLFLLGEKGDAESAALLAEEQAARKEKIEALCWDGDRFIRGFTEAGEVLGRLGAREAELWLNPQSWAVISGLAEREQAQRALDLVHERLNTAWGAVLMDPPFREAFPGALAVIFNAGLKENAGIFSQTQGWLILAEALLGRGERAFEYFAENAPSRQNDRAEIRCIEPYCYGQFTEGPASPHFGRSHVHWLTGTASTVMVGCVEGILGVRPTLHGLRLAPAVPKTWKELELWKSFRGRELHIVVRNPDGKESGCSRLLLNGVPLEGDFLLEVLLRERNEIELRL